MAAALWPKRTSSAARALGRVLPMVLAAACQPGPPPSRVATGEEAGPEQVVVNYAPQRLRALPAGNAEQSYLLLGSERPLLPAVFRPLGVTARKAPADSFARAGELSWVGGHVVAAAPPPVPPQPQRTVSLLVYDRDSKVATPTAVALPAACTQTRPALLHSDGHELYALIPCPPEDAAIVLHLSAAAELRAARVVPGAGAAELLVHTGDADYLLAASKLLRSDAAGRTISAAVPTPGRAAAAEARELVHTGALVVVLDGDAGRMFAYDSASLQLRYERRLYRAHPVTRLRAAVGGPDRLIVASAEQDGAPEAATQLVAMAVPLSSPRRSEGFPTRILLGSGPARSDHELVPIADSDGGGALLLRTHAGNTGPLVALTRLHL